MMKTKQEVETKIPKEMLDKIYEVIANKELTMWCKIYDSSKDKFAYITNNNIHEQPDVIYEDWTSSYVKLHKEYIKIIWHPVMIWDVLDWVLTQTYISKEDQIRIIGFDTGNKDSTVYFYYNFIHMWEETRKPIEDQHRNCISLIYSLLP